MTYRVTGVSQKSYLLFIIKFLSSNWKKCGRRFMHLLVHETFYILFRKEHNNYTKTIFYARLGSLLLHNNKPYERLISWSIHFIY